MNNIFIRVFSGLLLALILVFALCVFAVKAVNQVRLEQYRVELIEGTFRLLGQLVTEREEYERDMWLQKVEEHFGFELNIKPLDSLPLTDRQKLRIDSGQVLYTITPEAGALIFTKLQTHSDESLVLVGHSVVLTEQHIEGTVYLILQALDQGGPRHDYREQLKTIQPYFNYRVSLVPLEQTNLSEYKFEQLQKRQSLLLIDERSSSFLVYALTPKTDQLIQLGPVSQLNIYPVYLVLLVAMMGVVLVGFVIYNLIYSLEQRIGTLERAASRIAHGHLNARVGCHGDDSVGRLGSSFNRMAEHIQRLIGVQREMIRAVSHELRTPVARIRFGVQMLQDYAPQEDWHQEQFTGIDDDIQELDTLIDEILTYARLEEGGPVLDFQSQDVESLVADVVEERRINAEHLQVVHQRSSLPAEERWAEVEPKHLHRAIHNLVSNATRYAKEMVTVSYSVNSETCRIDVEDDGPGIPEDEWDRVFTPFARLDDSRTRASGGYGLGLSIVRRIVYWHGGKAMVSRSKLGGAKFTLVWPRRQSML